MISIPPLACPANSADASLRVSSRPRKQNWFAVLCAFLAALLCGAASIASAQTAHLNSGGGTQTTVGSGFSEPAGVAVDSSGNVYVADYMNAAVKEILAVNGVIPASPTIVTLGSAFIRPVAVALDGSGNLYVADSGSNPGTGTVKELLAVNGSIPASPTIRTLASLYGPLSGVAVDGKGNLYVTEGCYLALGAYSGNGVNGCGFLIEFLAVNGSLPASPNEVEFDNSFNSPGGIVLDSSGNVYVADEGDNSIKEILAVNGSISVNSPIVTLHTFTGTAGPAGLVFDASGDLIVTDFGTDDVYELLAVNGSIPASPTVITLSSGFNYPFGVTLGANGNLFIADSGNNRVVEMAVPTLSLSNQAFGSVNIGSTSPANTLAFVFDTGGTLGGTAVLTQGAPGLDFKDAGTGTCAANTAYTAGESCTINVTFKPRFAGIRTGSVVLYNSTGNAIASGYVQGTGVGPQIAFLPGAPSTLGGFNSPTSVAVDGSGNVYVANFGNNAVKEIMAVNGSIPASPTIKTLGSGFFQPRGVAVDGSGNVYVSDSGNGAVKEIMAVNGGIPVSPAIVTLATGFNTPYGVAVDRAGNVFVGDYGNYALKEIVAINGSIPASPTIRTLESNVIAGYLAVDGTGNVYFPNYLVVEEILAVNGSIPASPTMKALVSGLSDATGIAVDGSGNVYVTNNLNAVSEIHAVNGSIPSSPAITPLSSGFNYPFGIAVDGSGNIIVADVMNNRVAKLDLADPPSLTFASTAVSSTSTDSPQTVTIENIGNATLTFPIPSTGKNPSIAGNFTLSSSGASACPVLSTNSSQPATLAAGASCQLPISFAPTAAGALSGSLVLTDNNFNAAAPGYTTQSIALSGTGTQFTISAPASVNLIQGTSSTSTITVIPIDGFTGSVQLFLSSLFGLPINNPPPGITASFSPNPTTGTSVLTLTASNAAATGTYLLSITGTSGSLTAATNLILTVNPSPSFSLDASPASPSVVQGGSGTSLITVTDLYGFAGSVQLAATNLPSGVTASFTPNPTPGTSTLTLTASGTAALGEATVTVIGTSGALTEPTFLVLTINPLVVTAPPPGVFGAVNIGTTSPAIPLTFTVVNGGTLGSTAVLTQGATGLDFVDAGTGTCAPNSTYAVGQACTINVTFTPKFAGARYGAVVLNDPNGNLLATGYLQGTGVGPQINFLPGTESTVASASSGLSVPYGVAVDGSGNVYISDVGNNLIWKETFSAGSFTQNIVQTSSLNDPGGVAVDGSGNIYIADTNNNRVVKETPLGTGYTESVVANFSNNGSQIYPDSLAVDGNGNVYISVASPATLYEETPVQGGYTQTTIPTPGVSIIDGIALDGNGNVYVIDGGNVQVLIETPSPGGYIQSTLPTSGLVSPDGIAVDGNGNVYIADSTVRVFKETLTSGSYVQSIVSTSNLMGPTGVAVDGSGDVYFADADNYRVLKEDLADAPSLTFASAPVGSTSADSPQTVTVENVGNATLSLPIPSTENNPSIASNFTLNSSGAFACPLLSAGSSTAGTLAAGASCLLSISFTPTSVGALSGSLVLTDNNLNAPAPGYATQTILLSGTATQATPTITWATPAGITYGTPLSRAQLSATSTVAGTFTYLPAAGTVLTAGQQTLTVTFTPTDSTDYTPASATVTFTVNQATPAITWVKPAAITYRTPLSATQLNATSTVAGSFTYSPAAGTILTAGSHTLSVTFTPTDTTDYTTATATVTLTVNKATPTITWPTPAAITYGTALSATQLDATASVAGKFAYSPAAGTVPVVGTDTLSVTFTPTDTTDYPTATASVALKVNPAPSFTLAASPATLTVTQGASGKSTIAVTALNGFTGKVTLAASGLPSGVTASFATNPTTGTSVLTLAASNTAVTGIYNVTIAGTSGSPTATTTIALTVNGFACHIGYAIESQWKGGFEAAVTINNTGVKSISNWTLTWTFANGQKITSIWDGADTQSGANVTVTNMSYNGSIPAGGSYTGLGINASWNNTTNAVPTSFAVNGTTCK